MDDFQNFSSNDFYLSAVILANGGKLLRLDRRQGNYVDFVFEESPEVCHAVIAAYWSDELKVSAKKMIAAINELKTRLHQGV